MRFYQPKGHAISSVRPPFPYAGEYHSEPTFQIKSQSATLRCAPGVNCSLAPFDEHFVPRLLEATAGSVLLIIGDSISHQIWQARKPSATHA